MLVQRDANINTTINTTEEEPQKEQFWRFLPQHFSSKNERNGGNISVFEGLVSNNWLGLTYIALEKLEIFGFSLAKAVEVAFKLGKFQFAKTLLGRALDKQKLQEILDLNRNLATSLSFWCRENTEEDLITDIFEMLRDSEVSLAWVDEFQCSPLHYAALNKNRRLMELLLLDSDLREKINEEDKFGRTALAAFFYNYKPGSGGVEEVEEVEGKLAQGLLDTMINSGARLNTLFPSRPLAVLQGRFQVKFAGTGYLDPPHFTTPSVSPLMISVVLRDVAMASYLLSRGADINTQDSEGRTAVMFAFKTRDRDMIDLILRHRSSIDLDRRDHHGHGVLDHAIALMPHDKHSPTFTDVKLMKQIMKVNFDKKSLAEGLKLARELGSEFSGTLLGSKVEKTSGTPAKIETCYGNPEFSFDHRKDSQQILEMMEKQLADGAMQEEESKIKPAGCVVKEGTIYRDYDVLMNKVDVDFGCHGMYNFYRLQIWKERHKELYILFTNWGRIERWGRGQYQNTPFSTPDEAVAEFCKIFKSKSGNEWKERHDFVEKPKKYRIVRAEYASRDEKASFEIDLMTDVKSRLPLSLQKFVRDISDINMLKKSYWKEKLCDSGNIPFERISGEVISKADTILEEIKPLIAKKEKFQHLDVEKRKTDIYQLGVIFERISKLSNEYYFLIPSADFSFEKVPPVDTEDILKSEKNRLKQLGEIELSKSIVVGSMLRKDEIHPLDYIFSCLDCTVEILEEDCLESAMILQYLYNSRGMNSVRVEEIFKLQRNGDKVKHQTQRSNQNRKLLWHGTKLANMISILSHGLLVEPPSSAVRTGRIHGDGVYLADVCDKSRSYSSGDYILLCDVQLGDVKVKDLKQYTMISAIVSKLFIGS